MSRYRRRRFDGPPYHRGYRSFTDEMIGAVVLAIIIGALLAIATIASRLFGFTVPW